MRTWRESVDDVGGLQQAGVTARIKAMVREAAEEEEADGANNSEEGKDITDPGTRGDNAVTKGRTALRNDHPVDVHDMHEENPETDADHHAGLLFAVLGQQGEERGDEVTDDDEDGHIAPAFRVTGQVKAGLFRDVRVPDEEILGEGDVGPEHREGKEQLAHQVEVFLGHHFLELLLKKPRHEAKKSSVVPPASGTRGTEHQTRNFCRMTFTNSLKNGVWNLLGILVILLSIPVVLTQDVSRRSLTS